MGTVPNIAATLEPEQFGRRVAGELKELRQDDAAWADYVADGDLAVGDGLA